MPDYSQSGAWMFPGEDGGRERHVARQQRAHARREIQLFSRRLAILLAALLVLVVAGTIGFALIEHVSPGYGFEWTLDTVTTLGSIPDPSDTAGRALKVGLELFGIGTLFYGLATVAEFFVSGQLSGVLEERRIEKMIDSFSDHYIVCGFGRVGRQVSRDLRAAGAQHVVVDPSPLNRQAAVSAGVTLIESEPSEDEVLLQAGIERAQGVIACVDSDAENIFITLTARELRYRHLHHRPRLGRGLREEAAAGRRGPGDLPLQDVGVGDGAGGPASAGRRRVRRGRLPHGGDRGLSAVRGGWPKDRRGQCGYRGRRDPAREGPV